MLRTQLVVLYVQSKPVHAGSAPYLKYQNVFRIKFELKLQLKWEHLFVGGRKIYYFECNTHDTRFKCWSWMYWWERHFRSYKYKLLRAQASNGHCLKRGVFIAWEFHLVFCFLCMTAIIFLRTIFSTVFYSCIWKMSNWEFSILKESTCCQVVWLQFGLWDPSDRRRKITSCKLYSNLPVCFHPQIDK